MPYELHLRCHFWINRTTRRSAIRCSMNFTFKFGSGGLHRECRRDTDPLSHTLRRSANPTTAFTIVGVVGDGRSTALTQESLAPYYPMASSVWPLVTTAPAVTDGICSLVPSTGIGLPRLVGVSAPAFAVSGPAQCLLRVTASRLAESPKATLYIRGCGSFFTSDAATIASGRSEPVPGRDSQPALDVRLSRRTTGKQLEAQSSARGATGIPAGCSIYSPARPHFGRP
jgi:hypothetical protein